MDGIWNVVKNFLGIAPAPSETARGPHAPEPTAVADPSPRVEQMPVEAVASPAPAKPSAAPSPHPAFEGILNAHRYSVGGRSRYLIGAPPPKPAPEGILNAERHSWRTSRHDVLNFDRHGWQPPFPEIINSGRLQWKPWVQ